jgi:hypothetical protein
MVVVNKADLSAGARRHSQLNNAGKLKSPPSYLPDANTSAGGGGE